MLLARIASNYPLWETRSENGKAVIEKRLTDLPQMWLLYDLAGTIGRVHAEIQPLPLMSGGGRESDICVSFFVNVPKMPKTHTFIMI